MTKSSAWLAGAVLMAACGGSTSGGGDAGSTGGASPAIAITTTGSLNLGNSADRAAPIAFTISNFTLKAPGACAGAAACGHVHVLIDGAACTPVGAPYNNAAVSSPASAKFGLCPTATGAHTVELQLHDDAHHPINDASGNVVKADATVTTVENAAEPKVTITDPTGAAPIALDASKKYAVKFTASGFTLMAPGTCGTTAACGHVHLKIDGDACSGGGAYNAAGVSPLSADFSKCNTATGAHAVTLELHNDDHSAVKDEYGQQIASTVAVEAQ